MGQRVRLTVNPETGEALVRRVPLDYNGDGSRVGVIQCHGYTDTEMEALDPSGWFRASDSCARAGFPVVTPLLATSNALGQDEVITAIGKAKTYLQGTVGAKDGKVVLVGTSGGFLGACNWARQNLGDVAGIIGLVPVCDLASIHEDPEFTTLLDSLYGGHSGYLAALATHNPAAYAAVELDIPMLLIYSTDDDLALGQDSFAAVMSAAHDSPTTVIAKLGGHSLANLNTAAIGDFLRANAS